MVGQLVWEGGEKLGEKEVFHVEDKQNKQSLGWHSEDVWTDVP